MRFTRVLIPLLFAVSNTLEAQARGAIQRCELRTTNPREIKPEGIRFAFAAPPSSFDLEAGSWILSKALLLFGDSTRTDRRTRDQLEEYGLPIGVVVSPSKPPTFVFGPQREMHSTPIGASLAENHQVIIWWEPVEIADTTTWVRVLLSRYRDGRWTSPQMVDSVDNVQWTSASHEVVKTKDGALFAYSALRGNAYVIRLLHVTERASVIRSLETKWLLPASSLAIAKASATRFRLWYPDRPDRTGMAYHLTEADVEVKADSLHISLTGRSIATSATNVPGLLAIHKGPESILTFIEPTGRDSSVLYRVTISDSSKQKLALARDAGVSGLLSAALSTARPIGWFRLNRRDAAYKVVDLLSGRVYNAKWSCPDFVDT